MMNCKTRAKGGQCRPGNLFLNHWGTQLLPVLASAASENGLLLKAMLNASFWHVVALLSLQILHRNCSEWCRLTRKPAVRCISRLC